MPRDAPVMNQTFFVLVFMREKMTPADCKENPTND
jgi:hypothetical protein